MNSIILITKIGYIIICLILILFFILELKLNKNKNIKVNNNIIESGIGTGGNVYRNIIEIVGLASGIITGMTFIEKRIKSNELKEKVKEFENEIEILKQKNITLEIEKESLSKEQISLYNNLQEKVKETLNINQNFLDNYKGILNKKGKNQITESEFTEEIHKVYLEAIEKNKTQEQILKNLVNNINKNNIINFNYKEYLDNFSVEQLGALTNLIFSTVIISSTLSIIAIIFGNYLLKRFNVEERFPKIARFIQLRKKFQQYYLIFSLLNIIICAALQIALALFILAT